MDKVQYVLFSFFLYDYNLASLIKYTPVVLNVFAPSWPLQCRSYVVVEATADRGCGSSEGSVMGSS